MIRDRAQMLDSMEDLRVRQVLALMDICLPDLIGSLVVEVLGGEGGGINGLVTAIGTRNHVLLNELRPQPPMLLQCVPTCVWLASAYSTVSRWRQWRPD